MAAGSIVNSMSEPVLRLRQALIDKGVLVSHEEQLAFTTDYIFSSPSSAAMIVMGRPANGLTEWKLENGKTLKEVEEK